MLDEVDQLASETRFARSAVHADAETAVPAKAKCQINNSPDSSHEKNTNF